MPLAPDKWGQVGGDNEPPILLNKLARATPEHEFVIIGRNSGDDPQSIGLPTNVTNPWTQWREGGVQTTNGSDVLEVIAMLDELTMPTWQGLDAVIVWAGQHGTSNSPIPVVGGGEVTNPQISFVNYASYIVRGISAWRDQDPHGRREIWLCPDPRNYLKARDLKWPPPPVLGQSTYKKKEKHYRYGDPTEPGFFFGASWAEPDVWLAEHQYLYSGLELVGIPSTVPFNDVWEGRQRFGIIINETRGGMKWNRLDIMKQWVLPLSPDWVHGKWTPPSANKLGIIITPVAWTEVEQKMQTVRSTFTTPASGSNWATAKPWEAFAAGTVCFFHPRYDEQDNILNRPGFEVLHDWLRVGNPDELRSKVDAVNQDQATWLWLVHEQRRLFDQAAAEQQCLTMIKERL
jgi:hypothetical protein